MAPKPITVLVVLLLLCLVAAGTLTSKKTTRHKQLINFLAGGVAGSISSTLTLPLEIVKTQLQSSRIAGSGPAGVAQRIWKSEGPGGFFKGLTPMLVGIAPTRAIYFWAYSTSKEALNAKLGNTPVNHLLSAFAAGIASNTVMNPLWMVKTRFQILPDRSVGQRAFHSYREVAGAIWKEEGLAGFFKGLSASYVGCLEGAVQWIVYEKMKAVFSAPATEPAQPTQFVTSEASYPPPGSAPVSATAVSRSPSPAQLFLAAAASKFVAILASYPHEVVRTRLREQATSGIFRYRGFADTLRTIAREEGVSGLYGGMGMHLLRSVPNSAIMFLSYELVSSWLDRREQQEARLADQFAAGAGADGWGAAVTNSGRGRLDGGLAPLRSLLPPLTGGWGRHRRQQ